MKRLRIQIGFFISARMLLNTGYRMIYPFLPVFARSLGVDIKTASFALAARSLAGAFGPLLAPLSDRKGRKFGMSLGFILFSAGAAASLLGPRMIFFTTALILMTVGKYVFDPAMQAYLGDRIPYARRGTALAVSELGWALSFILGVPAAGFLIAEFGWRSPFMVLGLLGFLTFITMRLFFPEDRPRRALSPREDASDSGRPNLTRESHFISFKRVLSSGAALSGLAAMLFISASNEVVNVTFGVWLEDSFGLKIAALGVASAVIGFSDLSGEILVAATVDRLGKIRATALGLTGNAAAALLLPLAGVSTLGALAGLFTYYLTFEYTIVSLIPLMSEVLPEARATLLALNTAAFSLGRAFTAWLALRLYEGSFFSAVLAAAVFNILALAALLRLRRLSGGKV